MRKIVLSVITLLIALTLFAVPALGADWWASNTENFESDTAGSDPSETWYTYTDSAWDYVFVNESDYRSSNHSYELNDTDGVSHFAWFNWTGDDFDYFELYFKIDNSTHEEINIYLGHTAGISNEVKIVGKQSYEPCVLYSNYTTTAWNKTISNNTWWRLRWDFNYTTDTIQCRLYNNASADQTSTDSTWLLSDPEAGALTITDFTGIGFTGTSGKPVQIFVDDMTIGQLQLSTRLRDNEGIGNLALIILLSSVIIIGFVLEAYRIATGSVKDIKELFMLVMLVVFLIIIMSLI